MTLKEQCLAKSPLFKVAIEAKVNKLKTEKEIKFGGEMFYQTNHLWGKI